MYAIVRSAGALSSYMELFCIQRKTTQKYEMFDLVLVLGIRVLFAIHHFKQKINNIWAFHKSQ